MIVTVFIVKKHVHVFPFVKQYACGYPGDRWIALPKIEFMYLSSVNWPGAFNFGGFPDRY